jgi:hypothetical protein
MRDIEKKFHALVEKTGEHLDIFSEDMPEKVEELQRIALGILGPDIAFHYTHAEKIPAILCYIFNIPTIDPPIMDHAGLTQQNSDIALRVNWKGGYFQSVGNRNYKVTEETAYIAKESPLVHFKSLVEFLAGLKPVEIGWLTERLLSSQRTYDGNWYIKVIDDSDFRDAYHPSLPRETALFNLLRFKLRREIVTGPLAETASSITSQELGIPTLREILHKKRERENTLGSNLIDLKNMVSNLFFYIEAANIIKSIHGGSAAMAQVPYLVYDWLQREEFTRAHSHKSNQDIVKHLKSEAYEDLELLLKQGFLKETVGRHQPGKPSRFVTPAARLYIDSDGTHYCTWEKEVVIKRYEQLKTRRAELRRLENKIDSERGVYR